MEGYYEMKFGGQTVGKAQVAREGLYYRFHCRCRLSGDMIAKVLVTTGGHQESLGVLVPNGDGFELRTRIPAKKLGQGTPEFHVVPNRAGVSGQFVPIKPEEPFSYIARLKDAYLACHNGQPGAIIKEAGT